MDQVQFGELLTALQRSFEQASMPAGDKLRALHTLSVMADHVETGTTSTPHAFAQAAVLFEFARAVPAAYGLGLYYPQLWRTA